MLDTENIQKEVDDDIAYCTDMYKKYSHDGEVMGELFNKMLFKYIDVVEGLADGLKVISCYEEGSRLADTYRANMSRVIGRLADYRENGYSNEGLLERYMDRESQESIKHLSMNFNEVRQYILSCEDIGKREKEEIIDKIDDIEEITMMMKTRREKWELLRPYVMWISGKDMEVSMRILPLFLKIGLKEG